jgi:TonB family protein
VAAALASLALNAGLVFLAARVGVFELAKPSASERVVLAPLTGDQWKANQAIAGGPRLPASSPRTPEPPPPAKVPLATAQAQKPPAPPPPEDKSAKGQVVDVAPSPDSRAPDKTRFLSDRDNRVEKETRSRFAGTKLWEKRAAAPSESGEAGQGGKSVEEREAREGAEGTNGKAGAKAATPAEPPTPSPERFARLEHPKEPGLFGPGERLTEPHPAERPKAPEQAEQAEGLGIPGAPGLAQEGQKKAGDPRLLPSVESMARIAGGPSNDYIDDPNVVEGDATVLNTRAWKFATFWNRFKQDVSAHWRPALVYNERDPTGTMFGDRRERATGVHVVLDKTGAVKDIRVVEASGLDFLDREAVRAVRAASPFYNVPPGLVDEHGEVVFSFGMVLVLGSAVPVRPVYQPGSR